MHLLQSLSHFVNLLLQLLLQSNVSLRCSLSLRQLNLQERQLTLQIVIIIHNTLQLWKT